MGPVSRKEGVLLHTLNTLILSVNNLLWSYLIIVLLIGTGIYFSLRTRFVQIRYLGEMFRIIADSAGTKTQGNQVSAFQAFCVSTASRVGVGNIAGIAIAVTAGGPGAVFWMWFIALLGASTGFVESTLAQIYKVPRQDGTAGFQGGPAYYIRSGLHSPLWSVFFAVLISVTYGLVFNSVQANTIALSLSSSFGIDRTLSGLILALLSGAVIFSGIGRIARITEWLVPLMAGVYLLVAIGIMIYHITDLPSVFLLIIKDAFSPDAAMGGGMGAAVMTGIKRGLFSNEAGMGSVPNAAATADANHPVRQGLVQSFGVFVDTFFICSASAFIVLLSGNYQSGTLTGIELVQEDLSQYFGSLAPHMLAFLIFLFAFTSIIGNYYYGEINIARLTRSKVWLNLFRILIAFMVFGGSVAELTLVWNMADLFMGLMVLTNVTAILLLFPQVKRTLQDYESQKKSGIEDPLFCKNVLPNQENIVCWAPPENDTPAE